jgi:hypothetical protein
MTFQFIFPNATNEQKWEQIRMWRNTELSKTDWTQLSDTPVDKVAWAEYRKTLRDLPEQNVLAEEAIIPTQPTPATTAEPVVEETTPTTAEPTVEE